MYHSMSSLPQPPSAALQHSQALLELIRSEIETAGGWISFERYMSLALYAPGLGYYAAGLEKFGDGGDFVTAPEISPLFGRCVARQAAQILRQTGGDVMELGAGSGKLAVDVLKELDALGCMPERYCILEVSENLRFRQKEKIFSRLELHLAQKVVWLDALPEHFDGVILGNEVLDALPVHLLVQSGEGLLERGLTWVDGLAWSDRRVEEGVLKTAGVELVLPANYLTELNLAGRALVGSLVAMLRRGLVLLVDYGFPRREYYHPQREQGTLMCHYRHQAHADPLLYPGLQDITAHVDFTSIAEIAVAEGAQLAGYATQTAFLLACGITDLLAQTSPEDVAAYMPQVAAAQKLLSPAEMGELFKVIAFGKQLDMPLMGFAMGDQRYRL
jgi:SAM-dependent MidA family methyltransferase